MRLFFLLLFIGLNGYTQKIKIENFGVYQNSSLDTLNNTFEVYFVDFMLTIDLDNFKKTYTDLHYENNLEREAGRLGSIALRVQDTLYFITGSGGLVHTIKNDTVRRIDKSFDHQMQHGACWFEHNNTAFTYGGYGFWSNRDFFTYYDPKQDEWEVYHPINSKKIPEGTAGSLHIKNNDEFHFFGGDIINPNNRRQRIKNNEVWTFNFNTKEWHYLGKHETLSEFIKKVNYGNSLVMIEQNQITSVDVKNNQKTIYQHSPISAQSTGFRSMHYANGKFFILMGNITGVYLNIVDKKDFFGPVVSQSKFYKNNTYWAKQILIYVLTVALIIAGFLITKRRFKKLNKLQMLDNGLKYRNKFREFKPDSMEILKLLLEKKEVPSSEILNIVEKEQYSPAHNERIKVQKIKDINLKIATLLGQEDIVITSYKSKHDRRIRVYTIDDSLF